MTTKILIVDDDLGKVQQIRSALSAAGNGSVEIGSVGNVIEAKKILKVTKFDLVILDVALPIRDQDEPTRDAGLSLLREIQTRPGYQVPHHIIGLTSYQDIYTDVADHFAAHLWSVLLYDPSSEGWSDQLAAKLRHIESVQSAPIIETHVDLCVVTALSDPELDAVLKLKWGWQVHREAGDATVYHKGTYSRRDGATGTVFAARAGNMGMASSAVLAMKMAARFKPRVLAMVGICAGDSAETSLGDIIVGNPCWDYGSGKHRIEGSAQVFEPAIYQLPISARTRGLVEEASQRVALDEISAAYAGEQPTTRLRVHVGPLASGAAVLADDAAYAAVKKQHRKLIGIDMEAYAVMLAGYESPSPTPETIVIKGVTDFADSKKGDKFRYFAAHVSANFLACLVELHDL